MKMLKPSLAYQRNSIPPIQHRAAEQVVDRLTGGSLKAIRKRLFSRSGQLCECPDCMAGAPVKLTMATMEVDHIVPVYLGGTHAWDNMRAVHVDCHKRITAEQLAERMVMGRTLVDHGEPEGEPVTRRRLVRDGDDDMAC